MALTPEQIEQLAQQARALGLSESEVDGFREMMLYRAAKPDLTSKLALSINALPGQQADTVSVFMDDMTALRTSVMERGASALLALSDDEWKEIMGEGANA